MTESRESNARLRAQRRRDIETIAALEAEIVLLQAQVVLVAAQPEHDCGRVVVDADIAHAARILADAFETVRRA